MKTLLFFITFFVIPITLYCTNVQVHLTTKDTDDLEYLTSIEIMDSLGNRIVQSQNQGERLNVDFADSIQGEIMIRITAIGYFPVEINYNLNSSIDSVVISGVMLVPSLRRKLPRKAICATWAPRKRDIPKMINIQVNDSTTQLVPDKDDVIGITYIEKEKTTSNKTYKQ